MSLKESLLVKSLKVDDDEAAEHEVFIASELRKYRERAISFLKIKPAAPAARGRRLTKNYGRKLALHILTCFFLVIYVVACGNYLISKIILFAKYPNDVLNAPWLMLLWVVEFLYYCGALITAVDNILPPSGRFELELDGVHFPTVHILLPCCKEPTEIPVESIRAALKLDYPNDLFKVLVLDDGGDDELRAICQTLQVETGRQVVYLRRTKVPGVDHHFKCGNLNYGLQHSDSDYVVMMDADMILHPNYLRRVLPYIVNSPDVAFVQVPQSFYNLPIGDPISDSSSLGYDRVLVHRDSYGYATCIGTGALFSRKLLDKINGFQPQSVTEDTTTAYTFFKEGYRSVYLNEKLQIGLTPWTFEGYIKQRCRWGQGAVQQFKSTVKEMFGKDSHLSFVLKVLFFWHSGYYLLSIVNFLLVTTMVTALAFRLKLNVGSDEENRVVFANLAYNLIAWRLYWMFLFVGVRQTIQSRNREESHFWWISPFFFKMLLETVFAYNSTFKFVPTSNIDRNARKGDSKQCSGKCSQLKHVRFHIVYVVFILCLVITIVILTVKFYGIDNCKESFFVVGISFFLLTTCAHMMLPVMHIIWPTSFEPSQRKSLLKYDADGTPVFKPEEDCVPKFHWSVFLYEFVSTSTLLFWMFVVWMIITGADIRGWCQEGTI